MKRHLVAIYICTLSSAFADCQQQLVTTPEGIVRARPTLNSASLWVLGSKSVVKWCGITKIDDRGITWNWVSFQSVQEPWEHEGWISSRILALAMPAQDAIPQPGQTGVLTEVPSPAAPAETNNLPDHASAAPLARTAVSEGSPINKTLMFEDIKKMHETYEANQARFFRDYKGKAFSARMKLNGVSENIIWKGTYEVQFGDGFMGDVRCSFSEKAVIDEITDWNKGDNILVGGIVKDHAFGAIILDQCKVSKD